ncbi:flotillin-like protein FloA [bacterium]|nr:flotillin-like protein FloA [bacterium]
MGTLLFFGFCTFCVFAYYFPVTLYMEAISNGVNIGFLHLLAMRFKRVDPAAVVRPLIMGRQAGIEHLHERDLEAHYLAGGNIQKVVRALVESHKANIDLNFRTAAAIDLAGRDVLEAVSMMINPKVLQTQPISGMSKDGIQVTATCRITLKANIKNLVGGAGEATILARVGEGVVTAIGCAATHKTVLGNPGIISQTVLSRGLDSDTAFDILSIDVMDVDIGRNIGAQLQKDQAQADTLIAQARAEQRRTEAVAAEEEMKAKVEEMRAKVIEAEANVPKALAEAMRQGRFQAVVTAAKG